MSPHDHNRTAAIIQGLLGGLILAGFVVGSILEARRRPDGVAERLRWVLYALPLPLLQLLTAYGLFAVKRWGRIFALLLSFLYVLLFPLGTLLAVYTWWVLYGEMGRRLYGLAASDESDIR